MTLLSIVMLNVVSMLRRSAFTKSYEDRLAYKIQNLITGGKSSL